MSDSEYHKNCYRSFPHLAHRWMLNRELYRCDGDPEPDPSTVETEAYVETKD